MRKQSLRIKLARCVRVLRAVRGWSQEELAEHASLHRTYIGAVERAERNISVDNLEKIALALRVPITNLFELENTEWIVDHKHDENIRETRAVYHAPNWFHAPTWNVISSAALH